MSYMEKEEKGGEYIHGTYQDSQAQKGITLVLGNFGART